MPGVFDPLDCRARATPVSWSVNHWSTCHAWSTALVLEFMPSGATLRSAPYLPVGPFGTSIADHLKVSLTAMRTAPRSPASMLPAMATAPLPKSSVLEPLGDMVCLRCHMSQCQVIAARAC